MILLYKFIIKNYQKIKNLKNFNLENNILINDNFDTNLSKLEYDDSECLSSAYNKLCNFYINKNHNLAKIQEFFITNKLCNKKVKKFIQFKNEIFFIFEKEKYIYYIFKNKNDENEIRKIECNFEIKDINSYMNDCIISIDFLKNLHIIKIDDKYNYTDIACVPNVDLFINDLLNNINLFLLRNFPKNLEIIYYYQKPKNLKIKIMLLLYICSKKKYILSKIY